MFHHIHNFPIPAHHTPFPDPKSQKQFKSLLELWLANNGTGASVERVLKLRAESVVYVVAVHTPDQSTCARVFVTHERLGICAREQFPRSMLAKCYPETDQLMPAGSLGAFPSDDEIGRTKMLDATRVRVIGPAKLGDHVYFASRPTITSKYLLRCEFAEDRPPGPGNLQSMYTVVPRHPGPRAKGRVVGFFASYKANFNGCLSEDGLPEVKRRRLWLEA